MKTNPPPNNFLKACDRCGYEANPNTATHCEICQYPLSSKQKPKRATLVPLAAIPLVGLVLGTAVLYWLWRNKIISPTATPVIQQPSQNVATPVALQSQAAQPSLTLSGLQTYNSMRDVQNVPGGVFNYAGAVPFAPLRSQKVNDAIAKAHPKFRLRYTEPPNNQNPSAGISITMLLDGDVSFAESSRPLKDEEYSKAILRSSTLQQVPIAIDGVAFFVHPDLPVTGLSIDRIQAILTGKIANWQQLGGPDLPIVPFIFDPKLASATLRLILSNPEKQIGRNAQIIRDYTESIRKVASTPGGISYGSAAIVKTQRSIRPISLAKANSKHYVQPFSQGKINAKEFIDGNYPLTRRLFVVIRRDGTIDEQAGYAYANLLLSAEGQQLVEQAGFVPIRQ